MQVHRLYLLCIARVGNNLISINWSFAVVQFWSIASSFLVGCKNLIEMIFQNLQRKCAKLFRLSWTSSIHQQHIKFLQKFACSTSRQARPLYLGKEIERLGRKIINYQNSWSYYSIPPFIIYCIKIRQYSAYFPPF